MRKRTYRRRYNSSRKGRGKNKNTAGVFVLAICCSVIAGYITANYIIGPALGLEAEPAFFGFINDKQETKEKTEKNTTDNSQNKTVLEDEIEVKNKSGFALQYGSFSVKEGAQQCVNDLNTKGIEANIIEKDGSYKVIGKIFDTKDEARAFKDAHDDGKDIFITEIP